MKELLEPFKADLKETIQKNARLLTMFTCMLIVLVGITLKENPERTLPILTLLFMSFILFFLLLNARVVIKSSISLITVLMLSVFGFRTAGITPNQLDGGSLWMMSMLLTYSLLLSYSYLKPSSKSRWSTLTVSTVFQFLFIYIGGLAGMNLKLTIACSVLVTALVFYLFYKVNRASLYSVSKTPPLHLPEKIYEDMVRQLTKEGYGVELLTHKNYPTGVLIWNDSKAYILSFMKLSQRLGVGGRKGQYLTYNGVNINQWLMDTYYNLTPQWRTAGAEIFLVLVDENNRNGSDAKTIGVKLPDTKKLLPVGVYPANSFVKKSDYLGLIGNIQKEYSDFTKPLTPKQVKALDMRLPKTDSED